MIPTKEEWDKDWSNRLRKGRAWFTDGACNQRRAGAGIYKYQRKIEWHISRKQDAIAFQGEVATILNCVISFLRKSLAQEQITIFTDSQTTVAALTAGGIKSQFVADCMYIEKLTVLSEVNQVRVMRIPGHSRTGQETLQKCL